MEYPVYTKRVSGLLALQEPVPYPEKAANGFEPPPYQNHALRVHHPRTLLAVYTFLILLYSECAQSEYFACVWLPDLQIENWLPHLSSMKPCPPLSPRGSPLFRCELSSTRTRNSLYATYTSFPKLP